MRSSTFFFFFIPVLAIALLSISILLAPHFPYLEKTTPFECGYHSFMGQNRTEFSIPHIMYAWVFMLLDLEILLVYPFAVSGYNNELYGLILMIIFFVVLTLGFVFELGKKALSINSKQILLQHNPNLSKSDFYSSKNLEMSYSERILRD